MSDKSMNAEGVRDFLQKNRAAHERLKELLEELAALEGLGEDDRVSFVRDLGIMTNPGTTVEINYVTYHSLVSCAVLQQENVVDEFIKKLERMACIVEEF